jgi:hypothetical protein
MEISKLIITKETCIEGAHVLWYFAIHKILAHWPLWFTSVTFGYHNFTLYINYKSSSLNYNLID